MVRKLLNSFDVDLVILLPLRSPCVRRRSPLQAGKVFLSQPMETGMTQSFLSTLELAERWRVSPRTLEEWRGRNRPPHPIKVGRRVLYRMSDVEALEQAEMCRLLTGAAQRGE